MKHFIFPCLPVFPCSYLIAAFQSLASSPKDPSFEIQPTTSISQSSVPEQRAFDGQ